MSPRARGLALLAGAAVVGAGLVAVAAPAGAAQETCPDTAGAWIKQEATGDGTTTMAVAAPSKMLIVETCVKAANEVVYTPYSPGESRVTVSSPAANDGGAPQSISHVSYRLEMAPTTPGACLPDLAACAPPTPPADVPASPELPAVPAPPAAPAPLPVAPIAPVAPVAQTPSPPVASVEVPRPAGTSAPVQLAPTPDHASAAIRTVVLPQAHATGVGTAAAPIGLAVTGADAWVVLAAGLLAGLGACGLALRRRLAVPARSS